MTAHRELRKAFRPCLALHEECLKKWQVWWPVPATTALVKLTTLTKEVASASKLLLGTNCWVLGKVSSVTWTLRSQNASPSAAGAESAGAGS
jgi:hypothetical protein